MREFRRGESNLAKVKETITEDEIVYEVKVNPKAGFTKRDFIITYYEGMLILSGSKETVDLVDAFTYKSNLVALASAKRKLIDDCKITAQFQRTHNLLVVRVPLVTTPKLNVSGKQIEVR